MPSKAYLMLRSRPPGPRFARPEDRLGRRLEARTAPLQPSLSNFLTASCAGMVKQSNEFMLVRVQ